MPNDSYSWLNYSLQPKCIVEISTGRIVATNQAYELLSLDSATLERTLAKLPEQNEALFVHCWGGLKQEIKVFSSLIVEGDRELFLLEFTVCDDQKARQNERFLKTIIDHIPNIIFVKDKELKYTFANKSFQEYSGRPLEEIIGYTDEDFLIEPSTLSMFISNDNEALIGKKIIQEYEEDTGFLGPRMIVTTKDPLYQDDEIIGLIGVANDLTSLRSQAIQLEKTEQFFQIIFESSVDGLIITKPDTLSVIDCNSKALSLLGYERKFEILGEPLLNFLPKNELWVSEALKIFREHTFTDDDRSFVYETDIIGVDKKTFYASIGVTMVYLNMGPMLLIRVTDISKEKALLNELNQSLNEKDYLLREIHHRVKNNLAVISSLLSLQANKIQDPASKAVFADSISRVKSIALVHEKLYHTDTVSSLPFKNYLKSLSALVLRTIPIQGAVSLDLEGDEDLTLDITKAVPCGLLATELITNALKHSQNKGARSLEIQIRITKFEDGKINLLIQDNGKGFDATIFQSNPEGSLGIILVKELCRQINGDLEIQSEKGIGSTISVTF